MVLILFHNICYTQYVNENILLYPSIRDINSARKILKKYIILTLLKILWHV